VTNPLLQEWAGPYGGVPPFDKVMVEYFEPALEAAMAEQLANIAKIASNADSPAFENTIAAMEQSGRTLDRVSNVYGIYSGTMCSADFQEVERKVEPRIAAFRDQIFQDAALFGRIAEIYESRERSNLTAEQQRLTWDCYTDFVHNGASLDPSGKKSLSEINERLASLYTRFSQNVLADENRYALILKRESDLAGLPPSLRSAAAAAAIDRGEDGKWAILNTRSSMEPFLVYSDHRDLREKVWRTFYSRGDNNDENDNKAAITEIVRLRDERAKLMGYPTHAHWRLEKSMAKTPERALKLLEEFWKPAVAKVVQRVAEMQAAADESGDAITIKPWDYRYYAEKVRRARYNIDENAGRPYLQLDQMCEALFWVAGELFDLRFSAVSGIPVVHADVRVWQVKHVGKHVGLFFMDPFARKDKRSGAWMSAYRNQQRAVGDVTPIISINTNFGKGEPGQPTLLAWDDARTLFHEFGHALHGLCSNVTYPSISGTNVVRDYVEFPSQLFEHWLGTPEVLQKYGRHYKTGQPMPQELIEKIERASKFNVGFENVEYLASALVDMRLHLNPPKELDLNAFERETLASLGMPEQVVMRHRLPHFGHLFSDDGYSAAYYSYLWADVLSADGFEAFVEAAGPYDKNVAAKLYENVLSTGNTVDPAISYRAFRGHDPQIGALLRKRGFA
jgi:peptidyl-dipeptidase Dcp